MPIPGHGLLCPLQLWMDDVAPLLARSTDGLTFLNAGANKGFTTAMLLQRFGGLNITNMEWYGFLQRFLHSRHARGTMHLCGVCCACVESQPAVAAPALGTTHVYAFEPVVPNYNFLVAAFEHYSTSSANATISLAALGNQRNMTVSVQTAGVVVGKENVVARAHQSGSRLRSGHDAIPVIMLDDWMKRNAIQRVDMALFDTEGWDLAILDGMAETLKAGSLSIFEIELLWPPPVAGIPKVNESLAWLHTLGYACFFEYDNGCLAPANEPRCHIPSTAVYRHQQNVVCALETPRSQDNAVTSKVALALWRISNICAASPSSLNAPKRPWIPTRDCFA